MWATVVFAATWALFGVFGVPVALAVVMEVFGLAVPTPSPWALALGGLVLGAAQGYWLGYWLDTRRSQRRQRMREAAGRGGLRFADEPVEALRATLEEVFLATPAFSTPAFSAMGNIVHSKSGAADLAIGDLELTHDNSDSISHSIQTAAVFRSSALPLPRFALEPRTLETRLSLVMQGGQSIGVEGHPEFSQSYHVRGIPSARVRALLQAPVLDYLARHPGRAIRGEPGCLVVYRPGTTCDPTALPAFTRQASDVFALFERAAAAAPTEARDSGSDPDLRAEAERITGPAGVEIRRSLVTRADIEALLAMPRPRKVPKNIRRNYVGHLGLAVALGGFVMLGLGAVMWTEHDLGRLRPNSARIVAACLMVLGPLTTLLALAYHRKKGGLLRNGIPTRGTITGVERASVTDGQTGYRVSLRFRVAGSERTATTYVVGAIVQDARRYAECGESVRLLYDAANPKRVLWPDALIWRDSALMP